GEQGTQLLPSSVAEFFTCHTLSLKPVCRHALEDGGSPGHHTCWPGRRATGDLVARFRGAPSRARRPVLGEARRACMGMHDARGIMTPAGPHGHLIVLVSTPSL